MQSVYAFFVYFIKLIDVFNSIIGNSRRVRWQIDTRSNNDDEGIIEIVD